jgi:protein gp37
VGKTKIEWTDWTWNPAWGCKEGCEYCYARKIARRFGKRFGMMDFSEPVLIPNAERAIPKKPCRVFTPSMGDYWWWPDQWIFAAVDIMKAHPQHTFQILTKHPVLYKATYWPENCWLGVSVATDHDGWRAMALRDAQHSQITFVSYEPMQEPPPYPIFDHDWVIVGVETGGKALPTHPYRDWLLEVVESCAARGVPLFMKESVEYLWRKPLIQEFPVCESPALPAAPAT